MEMAYGESNSHVSDNVTWPWKVTLVTSIGLEFSISKMAVDRGPGSKGPPTGNGLCRIEWSRDPERSSRDPNTLTVQYLENSRRCYLAIRSAILATAWLLVLSRFRMTGT